MSFLPPAPKYTGVVHYEDVPKLEINPYLSETPKFFGELSKPPQPTQADTRVERANERLEQGKKFYQAGDMEKARREFDRAIEILMGSAENLPDRFKVEKRLEEMALALHRLDINGLGAADLPGRPGCDKAPLERLLELTLRVNPDLKP